MTPPGMKENAYERPWELAVRPFRVAPHIWFVGNAWVSSYLVAGTSELVLIDTGIPSTLYLLLESIRSLGFEPEKISRIFLSHSHFDHDGAVMHLKKLTGASVWMSREEQEEFRADASIPQECKLGTWNYEPDCFYDDAPVDLGGVVLHPVLTPGHTLGTVTFLAEDTDADGRKIVWAMHGGVGVNTMNDAFFAKSGISPTVRERFLADCERLKSVHVDICCPSHPPHAPLLELVGDDRSDYTRFIDPASWPEFLEERMDYVRDVMESGVYPY